MNGWVTIYEISGCGFESRSSHLNFRYCTCFEHGVPWHSGNYRVQVHSKRICDMIGTHSYAFHTIPKVLYICVASKALKNILACQMSIPMKCRYLPKCYNHHLQHFKSKAISVTFADDSYLQGRATDECLKSLQVTASMSTTLGLTIYIYIYYFGTNIMYKIFKIFYKLKDMPVKMNPMMGHLITVKI